MSERTGIRIDQVVTRGGDRGETSLADGTRLAKNDDRIEALGAVDEANAALGMLRAGLGEGDLAQLIARCQSDLFDLGAGLCRPGPVSRLPEAALATLEDAVAALNANLAPLTSFVLPGGSPQAASAHMARTLVRRAERRAWALDAGVGIDSLACRYLNRLSDALFVIGRHLNDDGRTDIAWVPAAKR